MQYVSKYQSPLGEIVLAADGAALTGLWFSGQKHFAQDLDKNCTEKSLPVFKDTGRWLDIYFSGVQPDFTPPIHFTGSAFQIEVWEILRTIPYGKTITYGEIAKRIAAAHGLKRTSAQAVGGAVGRNKISVIVPCHRVVGADGNLTGYAGGIDRKIKLLTLENVDMKNFFVPGKGTAL